MLRAVRSSWTCVSKHRAFLRARHCRATADAWLEEEQEKGSNLGVSLTGVVLPRPRYIWGWRTVMHDKITAIIVSAFKVCGGMSSSRERKSFGDKDDASRKRADLYGSLPPGVEPDRTKRF
ncbi:hypothetical protein KIPB_011984 [Kipferlia bialata]|uniref:Uncharacterized protein n=1 Tax=Kipferlia bialata TaxID=797122 RepID=A0A391NUZ1_9EUKA|nr:hypothetical protein KIPB_011984 [Kipferlia bialata]|eukprot:g11984.t1